MTTRVGKVTTTGVTDSVQIDVTDKRPEMVNGTVTYFMKVLTGTVKFSVGPGDAGNQAWSSTDTIPPITCYPGELYAQQTAGGDTFVVH